MNLFLKFIEQKCSITHRIFNIHIFNQIWILFICIQSLTLIFVLYTVYEHEIIL